MKRNIVIPECFCRESRKWIPAFAGMTLVLLAGCRSAPSVDPEARSALEAIGGAFSPRPGDVKYCPVDGTRYSGDLKKCPKCGAALKPVQ